MNETQMESSPVLLEQICSSNQEARLLIENLLARFRPFFFFQRKGSVVLVKKENENQNNIEDANIDVDQVLKTISAFMEGFMQQKPVKQSKSITNNISHQVVINNKDQANFKIEENQEEKPQQQELIKKLDQFVNCVTFLEVNENEGAGESYEPPPENNENESEQEEEQEQQEEGKKNKKQQIDGSLKENFQLYAQIYPFDDENKLQVPKTRKGYNDLFNYWEFFSKMQK